MIRKIIIPTWIGHFNNAKILAKSYEKYVIDKDKISLCFITSNNNESKLLREMIGENFEILDLQTLLLMANYKDGENLFKETAIISGKHPYQAIKKTVSLWLVDYDQCLLMDSEGCFIKETNLSELFDEYFENPFVFYSSLSNHKISNLHTITKNSIRVIGHDDNYKDEFDMWCFEYQGWFIDKKLFLSFINHVQSLHGKNIIEVMKDPPTEFFEVISYYFFLRRQNNNYRFLSCETEMKKTLQDDISSFFHTQNGMIMIEFLLRGANENNFENICNFINKNNIKMLRIEPDFNIPLCERIIKKTNTSLLVCSELMSQRMG